MLDNEYLLDMRIKNNVLYQRIMSECNSVIEFANKYKIHVGLLNRLLNFKQPIYDTRKWLNGKIVPSISNLLEKLDCELYDIIPEDYKIKETNHFFKEIDAVTMSQLSYTEEQSLLTDYTVEDLHIQNELKENLNKALMTLNPREERAVRDYYYFGKTYDEIGLELGVGRERIRQIIKVALRKLRHPSRNQILISSLPDSYKNNKEDVDKVSMAKEYFTQVNIPKDKIDKLYKKYYPVDINFEMFLKLIKNVKVSKKKFAIYLIYHNIRARGDTKLYNKVDRFLKRNKIEFK